jgi:hypothetical protein
LILFGDLLYSWRKKGTGAGPIFVEIILVPSQYDYLPNNHCMGII